MKNLGWNSLISVVFRGCSKEQCESVALIAPLKQAPSDTIILRVCNRRNVQVHLVAVCQVSMKANEEESQYNMNYLVHSETVAK